jgi:hypothetical protein
VPDFFFFAANGANASAYATRYLERFQPRRRGASDAVLAELPPLLDSAAVAARAGAEQRPAAERYFAQQTEAYRERAAEQMPLLPGEVAEPPEFVALAGAWRSYRPGTIGCVRRSNDGGLLALFTDWSLDKADRLVHTPSESAPRAAAVYARPADVSSPVVAKDIADVVLQLANYIGQGLTLSGWPIVGVVVSFLSTATQQLVDGAFGESDQLLDQVATLLEANKISLELDVAEATMTNYEDFMQNHYSDAWLQEIMTRTDPSSPDYQDKLTKLQTFVDKITSDFDTTAPLFTAVDLMRVDTPTVGDDIDKASEAMYKAGGFFYLANATLTLGRQAFNAQLTMQGEDASRKIAGLLASFSKIYTAYAQSLKAVVDQQVESRVALIRYPQYEEGGRAEISDYVIYNPRYYDSDWAYPTTYTWYENCCGDSDCSRAWNDAATELPQLQAQARTEYHAWLCGLFWDGSAQSFDDAFAAMADNDAKLQELTT